MLSKNKEKQNDDIEEPRETPIQANKEKVSRYNKIYNVNAVSESTACGIAIKSLKKDKQYKNRWLVQL
jgi:hypothetical protein